MATKNRDLSNCSEDSRNGPPNLFSKGIISIKYKKSPIRLVSPPVLKKTVEQSSQSVVVPPQDLSSPQNDQQNYFREPRKPNESSQKDATNYWSGPVVSRNDHGRD